MDRNRYPTSFSSQWTCSQCAQYPLLFYVFICCLQNHILFYYNYLCLFIREFGIFFSLTLCLRVTPLPKWEQFLTKNVTTTTLRPLVSIDVKMSIREIILSSHECMYVRPFLCVIAVYIFMCVYVCVYVLL